MGLLFSGLSATPVRMASAIAGSWTTTKICLPAARFSNAAPNFGKGSVKGTAVSDI